MAGIALNGQSDVVFIMVFRRCYKKELSQKALGTRLVCFGKNGLLNKLLLFRTKVN